MTKHESPMNGRSPLQLRQASPFPIESTNRRVHYVTAAAPNPQDRNRSSGECSSYALMNSQFMEFSVLSISLLL